FRKFVIDFTDEGAIPKDPLELARTGKQLLEKSLGELHNLASGSRYPFIDQLNEPIQLLAALCAHTEEWFITEFKNANELLDAKDNVIDPIKQFLNGSQRGIYDEAARFTQRNQANIVHLPTGAIDVVVQLLDDPKIF